MTRERHALFDLVAGLATIGLALYGYDHGGFWLMTALVVIALVVWEAVFGALNGSK